MRSVHIRDEVNPQGISIRRKGLADHQGSQIGASYSDIDHIGKRQARAAPPSAVQHPVHEAFHPQQDFLDQCTGNAAIRQTKRGRWIP